MLPLLLQLQKSQLRQTDSFGFDCWAPVFRRGFFYPDVFYNFAGLTLFLRFNTIIILKNIYL